LRAPSRSRRTREARHPHRDRLGRATAILWWPVAVGVAALLMVSLVKRS
jgi:type VI protein secretion system component VasF